MKRLTKVALAFLMTGLFLFDASPGWACSWVPSTKHEQAGRADIVFTGEVLEVRGRVGFNERTAQRLLTDATFPWFGEAVFQVETALKGYPRRRQVVAGFGLGASCGVEFQPGKTYTVFARGWNGYLETSASSGTVEGQIDGTDYGLPPEQPSAFALPHVVLGVDENQPNGQSRWILLALVATSAVTAAVAIRYLMRAVRKLPFFK